MDNKLMKKLKAETDKLISLYNLGRIDDLERSARCYVKKFPEQWFGWKVLGVSRQKLGKYSEAVSSYRQAISLAPDDPELHNNLGVAFKELGAFAEAESSVRTALNLRPSYPMAYNNLGNILRAQGKSDQAVQCYRKALDLNPRLAMAYNNLGNVCKELTQYEASLEAYQKAVECDPTLKEAFLNAGSLLVDLGSYSEALDYLWQAVELDNGLIQAFNSIGNALQGLGRIAEAENVYREALEKDPGNALILTNLGNALLLQGRLQEALESYHNALSRHPELLAPMVHRAMASLPAVTISAEESRKTVNGFNAALGELETFAGGDKWADLGQVVCVRLPFYLSYRPGNHRDVLSRYGDVAARARHAWVGREREKNIISDWSLPKDRVRLGIVCGDVRKHSVWFVMLKGLLEHLDRTVFEVIIYHTDTTQDEETDYARSLADRFEQGPKKWVGLITTDAPDILFYPELAMDLAAFELALLRLAPLQVTTWGHPITSGLPEIDLFFSGELLESAEADDHYREKLIRLPGTGACSSLMTYEQKALDKPPVGLSADRLITRFVVCQRAMKFDPEYDALYARIAVQGNAHFWFVRDVKMPWASDVVARRIRRAFEAAGLDPDQYVTWIDWIQGDQFGALLEEMDIYLDTPAFSGFTTAWQAVHSGLPVVTIEGSFLRQRLAAGLLRRIGVTDTIARDSDEFVSIAVSLSKNRDTLLTLRQRLRDAAPAADNDVAVVRAFERELMIALSEKKEKNIVVEQNHDGLC